MSALSAARRDREVWETVVKRAVKRWFSQFMPNTEIAHPRRRIAVIDTAYLDGFRYPQPVVPVNYG